MRRSRLFWKLFLLNTALGLATVAALALAFGGDRSLESRRIWVVGLCAAGAVVVVNSWLVRWIVGSLARLAATADAIAAGDSERTFSPEACEDLGLLGESLARMHLAVRGRMADAEDAVDRLTTVLGGMDEGVIAIGADRSVFLTNPAARRMLDLSTQPPQGAPLADVLPDVQLRQAALEALRQRTSRRLTLERNGTTERVLGIQATPIPGNPCPGVVLVMHDETELRRLESLRQEFVANVSHELKTPLSSIKAYAETLSQGAIHDPQNNLLFVTRIEEQADRLHQLILDLLRLARIESGEQTFEIGAVVVANLVDACLADHSAAAQAKSIQLQCDADDPKAQVRADEEGMRQILDNLVDNAIKYTPEGGTVLVLWGRHGNTVRMEVRDTGIGIPRELQPRVFERFFRVDKARSRELGGTGLGLSIVKHLAQSFGGSVSVESQPGEGSSFTVELPAA